MGKEDILNRLTQLLLVIDGHNRILKDRLSLDDYARAMSGHFPHSTDNNWVAYAWHELRVVVNAYNFNAKKVGLQKIKLSQLTGGDIYEVIKDRVYRR